MRIRTGDAVEHRPSGQLLTVAYADSWSGMFAAFPPHFVGEGFVSDLLMNRQVDDAEYFLRLEELRRVSPALYERAAEIALDESRQRFMPKR